MPGVPPLYTLIIFFPSKGPAHTACSQLGIKHQIEGQIEKKKVRNYS